MMILAALFACGKRRKGPSYSAEQITAQGSSACAIMKDGSLRCWGAVGTDLPDPIAGFTNVTSACESDTILCAVSGGTARCTKKGGASFTIDGALEVSCERARVCALVQGAAVGSRHVTCIGEGATRIDAPGLRSIASGPDASCAVLDDGTARCFGSNADGLLGDGTTEPHTEPIQPRLSEITQISLGAHHACALTRSERVYCWGRNTHGQLGDGTFTDRFTPALVPGLTGIGVVAAGGEHTCAHRKDATIRCWGSDAHHQLGLGGVVRDVPRPTMVPGLYEATTVTCGDAFTCARMEDGWLRCWGANEAGQIGDGTKLEREVPTPIRF
jgi:alpha-tubulin suppressor-like RCC1 family protein